MFQMCTALSAWLAPHANVFRDDITLSSYPFLEDGDALVLERLAELHDLGALRVDGERRHDEVHALLDNLPNQAGPLLGEEEEEEVEQYLINRHLHCILFGATLTSQLTSNRFKRQIKSK